MSHPQHNHITRDIKRYGVCPACDRYLQSHAINIHNEYGLKHTHQKDWRDRCPCGNCTDFVLRRQTKEDEL